MKKCVLSFAFVTTLIFGFSCEKIQKDFQKVPIEIRDEPASPRYPERQVFETSNFGCTVQLWVPKSLSNQKRPLTLEDHCPSREQTLASLAMLLGAVLKNDPVSRFDTLHTCDTGLRGFWSEEMALASVSSKTWIRTLRKRKGALTPTQAYVHLFNQKSLDDGLSKVFMPYFAAITLSSVDRIYTSSAKLLPFAKSHPSLARSKNKVLMDASCWTFLIIPQGAS